MSKKDEYIEMFYSEAIVAFEEIDTLITIVEKNPQDKKAIDSIFRITHTMKGNAMGLGLTGIAELSHIIEAVFVEVKAKRIPLDRELCNNLFKASDKLGALINAIKTSDKISYKGIRTKLEVYLRKEASTSNEKIVHLEKEEELTGNQDKQSFLTMPDQIQIPIKKLDTLLNLVGELIIEKEGLQTRSVGKAREFVRLGRIASDLQYSVLGVRMVKIEFLFNKFHRIVRDVASIESKEVHLYLEGIENEIDRSILKIMSDSLVHLVRNAVSHGIEAKSQRIASGKSAIGSVTLRARSEKNLVHIEIEDDGRGIHIGELKKKAIDGGFLSEQVAENYSDHELLMLIFESGFSNTETVTEISGRGVGMDVVKRAVESVGGMISVHTAEGKGTNIIMSLPSSMSVKGVLLFEVQDQKYGIPLAYIQSVFSIAKKNIHKVGDGLMANYHEEVIRIVFLEDIFLLNSLSDLGNEGVLHKVYDQLSENVQCDLIIVKYHQVKVGIVVGKLLQQKEVMEKPLKKPLDQHLLFTGATIIDQGHVCLLLDINRVLGALFKELKSQKRVYEV